MGLWWWGRREADTSEAANGPGIDDDVLGLEAQAVDGILHHHVHGIGLILREWHTLWEEAQEREHQDLLNSHPYLELTLPISTWQHSGTENEGILCRNQPLTMGPPSPCANPYDEGRTLLSLNSMAEQQEMAHHLGKGGQGRDSPCFQQSLDGSIPELSIQLCHREETLDLTVPKVHPSPGEEKQDSGALNTHPHK